jgi:hypothetical protein
MAQGKFTFRAKRSSAWCALVVTCLIVATAAARDDAQASTDAKKPAVAHKTAAKKPQSAPSGSTAKKVSSKTAAGKKSSRKKKTAKVRGQQKIDSERSQAIQEALIRAHYLSGEPTGSWNDASEAAMRKFQADNGWQSKTVPDSRALIKLGLGPSKDHWLNPESAMTTVPDRPRAEALPTTSNSPPADATPVSPTSSGSDASSPR